MTRQNPFAKFFKSVDDGKPSIGGNFPYREYVEISNRQIGDILFH
jgi:hypothetical protein